MPMKVEPSMFSNTHMRREAYALDLPAVPNDTLEEG